MHFGAPGEEKKKKKEKKKKEDWFTTFGEGVGKPCSVCVDECDRDTS